MIRFLAGLLPLLVIAGVAAALTVWVLWDRIARYTDRGVIVGGVEYRQPFDMAVVCAGERDECAAYQAWAENQKLTEGND